MESDLVINRQRLPDGRNTKMLAACSYSAFFRFSSTRLKFFSTVLVLG